MPLVSGRRAFEMLVRIDFWEQTWELLAADRLARARGEAPAMLPVVDPDPSAQSALPTPDSYEFFSAYKGTSWKNEVTLRTLEFFQGYEPGELGKFGMAVDNLLSTEVVLASSEVVIASEGTDPDLF